MPNRLNIELVQSWDTLDEAIDYFLNLVLELQAAKRFPTPPTDLFICPEHGSVEANVLDDLKMTLTNL